MPQPSPIDPRLIDFDEAERILCARSFRSYVQRAWRHIIPDTLKWNWHMDAICDHLQALATGGITNHRLLINVPPGSSKSTLVGVMYPSWLWGAGGQPWHRYIGAAHEQGLAVRDNRLTRELISSEWYCRLWPMELSGDQNEKLYFENDKRGFRQACAVASMTGRRGHTIGLDDPLSPEKAHSETHRKTAIRVLTETIPTRLNDPATSAIVIVMQRLHEKDPAGYVLANGLGYEHLCIPMEFEPKRRFYSCIGWTDPRQDEGELMFPERFPEEVVARDKKALGSYAWGGQMQQRPAPLGGGIFKDHWWRYLAVPPITRHRVIYADTALKTEERNDYSVFQCWGETLDGQMVLLDMIRDKWEAPQLETAARAFWNKHLAVQNMGTLRAMKVEDKASGTGLIQRLKNEGIPILPIQRNIDKVTRAMDVAPLVESGNVILMRNLAQLSDFLTEASVFPNGEHDDMLDAAMSAISDMSAPKAAPAIRAL